MTDAKIEEIQGVPTSPEQINVSPALQVQLSQREQLILRVREIEIQAGALRQVLTWLMGERDNLIRFLAPQDPARAELAQDAAGDVPPKP